MRTSCRGHPTGQELVFIGSHDGHEELYRYDLETERLTRLTNLNSRLQQPEWSPDGEFIVFVSNVSGNNDLWLISRDGERFRQLTDTEANEQYPVWMAESD